MATMLYRDNPCKECKDRPSLACHSHCEKYRLWREAYDSRKEQICAERSRQSQLDGFEVKRKKRSKYRR